MACGVFGGLMTKYYIRVGLLSGDNEASWKPAQPLMAGPLRVIKFSENDFRRKNPDFY